MPLWLADHLNRKDTAMSKGMLSVLVALAVGAGAPAQDKITIKRLYLPGTYVRTQTVDVQAIPKREAKAPAAQSHAVMVWEIVAEKPQGKRQKLLLTCKRISATGAVPTAPRHTIAISQRRARRGPSRPFTVP